MSNNISSSGVDYYFNLFNSIVTPRVPQYQAKDIKVCSIPTGMRMLFSPCCGTSIIENFFSGQNGDFATPDEMKARRISYYS